MFFKQRETPAASRRISASCQEEVTWVPSTWQLQAVATLSHPYQFAQITAQVGNKAWLSRGALSVSAAARVSGSFLCRWVISYTSVKLVSDFCTKETETLQSQTLFCILHKTRLISLLF